MSRLNISRRDFINGVALGIAGTAGMSPLELLAAAKGSRYYPPGLTGLRGSHAGSFEIAHAVAWGGAQFEQPGTQTDETYDLVVVGGGISGLAAAHFYRQKSGPDARILVLDNHDDFGGHAKRNEFDVDGKKLLCYGGSQSIDTPGHYSEAASQLLKDVGIDTQRFYDYFDQQYFKDRGLGRGIYFSKEQYGKDATLPGYGRGFGAQVPTDVSEAIASYPISEDARSKLLELLGSNRNYLPDMSGIETRDFLRGRNYRDYLLDIVGMPQEVYLLIRDSTRGFWGVGWDALSALEAYRLGMPGTSNLEVGGMEGEPPGRDEPYIFHFPDGNAGVSRSLVRKLIPDAVPGHTMEDLVTSVVDYERLDQAGAPCRIRLNSTAVDVHHTSDDKHVDVTYVSKGSNFRVRGKHVVLACYNNLIPHICSELPEEQVEAIAYASKVPLVYISIAVRNWRAMEKLGFSSISIPQSKLMHSFGMDFPVSMGDYNFTGDSSEPTVMHGTFVPTTPDQGLSAREQHTLGRRALYEMTFEQFERDIVNQMQGALSPGGFDAERDIAGLTVNRWPHGYAYEYNDLSDPADWNRYKGPHLLGAAQVGRISIANSDAAGYAYVNGAIDAADRAVREQTS